MKIIYTALTLLAALSSCTPQTSTLQQQKPSPAQETTAYTLFTPSLTEGKANFTGYISSREQLYNWLIENRAANRELAKFLVTADLKTQKIYLHEYLHTGSSQDNPASKVTQNGKTLTLEIFDSNTSPIRTKDLRTSTHFAAIIIDKNKISKIEVVNKMSR